MDETTIQAPFRLMLQALLGMPDNSVRPQDNQPSEGDQFAIVQFVESEQLGWSGGNVGATQSGTIAVNMDFFGDNAALYARQIKIAMQQDYAINELLKLNMGFLSCNNPTDLTALELDQTPRFRVKIMLSYTEKYILEPNESDIPIIDKVPIGLIVSNPNGD